jgi:hypothetical protein
LTLGSVLLEGVTPRPVRQDGVPILLQFGLHHRYVTLRDI